MTVCRRAFDDTTLFSFSFFTPRRSSCSGGSENAAELTTISLQMNLEPLGNNIACAVCQKAFRTRLDELLNAWNEVKVRSRVLPSRQHTS